MSTKTKPHPAPKPARGKLPRARVMHANSYAGINNLYVHADAKNARSGRMWADGKVADPDAEHFPVVVLPCRTLKQARALVKLHGMSQDKLRDFIQKSTPYRHNPSQQGTIYWWEGVTDALAALGLGGGKP